MNNDIPSELTKYIRTNTGYVPSKSMPVQKTQDVKTCSCEDYEKTQNYFNALGRTKVNIDKASVENRVTNSVEGLKADPCYVQNHVDFCDELVKKGYSLEEAIEKTDYIFDKLKDEDTYRS